MIKAIETEYAGCRFRSRLEARWAVFFQTLGVKWRYEEQGFTFDGVQYLPDFHLPEIGTYCEVKGGDEALASSMDVLRAFSRSIPRQLVVILGDVPNVSDGDNRTPAHTALLNGSVGPSMVVGDLCRQFTWMSAVDYPETTRPTRLAGLYSGPHIISAYAAARRARFEHGERG